MTTYIALLRAVNVAGQNLIGMPALCDFVRKLGFADAKSLLQSGNLVFRGEKQTGAQLEALLEREAAKRLSLQTDFFIRSDREWRKVIERNPFPKEAQDDPGRLVVVFLKNDAKNVDDLRAAIRGPERVSGDGRHLYIVYPDGQGRSKLTGALIERKLGTRGTARNWNTVLKLAAATKSPATRDRETP